MDALSVLKTMVTRYHQVAEEVDLENRASALDYGPNEIMAIASIIQAETGNKEDMPLISAVVHNRLAEGWPLEMDSTCFYELGTHGLALTEEQKTACKNAPGNTAPTAGSGCPSARSWHPGSPPLRPPWPRPTWTTCSSHWSTPRPERRASPPPWTNTTRWWPRTRTNGRDS